MTSFIALPVFLLVAIPFATCAVPATVTDVELATFSEDILSNDVNNCGSLVSLNTQGSTCFSCTKDAAPEPLLTVRTEAYQKPTISKLLPLHNNYVFLTGQPEVVTNDEVREETEFLDAIMTTPAMKKAEKFLLDKRLIVSGRRSGGGQNNAAVRDAVQQIWFGLYSRENRTLGSSGFEHVFLGEVKNGQVSGFHNWVFFSKEEVNSKLNYRGRIGTVVNLGAKGKILKHKFDWNNREKPISSMFVGTSPEFEIALYTVCFYARPGARCPVKLNGKNVNIQTHYMNRLGNRYVASAFPDI
ncbi:poly(U)-specific endoribonuclease homolog isoform X2 [Folsomia candida]|uniref:poly(U)-specific endoribonuclease homolog isoform X2 n=1 Tax=Folsomia candida TaxID=158441 RepID=UPI000B8F314E|nr:poly(U)-specific endoribonuclease homolog isoform X2 [Folsomia candida]